MNTVYLKKDAKTKLCELLKVDSVSEAILNFFFSQESEIPESRFLDEDMETICSHPDVRSAVLNRTTDTVLLDVLHSVSRQ